jgi:hypothetical protein
MRSMQRALLSFALFLLPIIPLSAHPKSPCDLAPLMNQHKDAATVQRLEDAWSTAYLTGDTNFEQCLLTPDFTEIMRNGEVKVLSDEIKLAEKNKNKDLKIADFPKGTILIHGEVAVAFGTTPSHTDADGRRRTTRYADYYVWENGGWHAYFAQQTEYFEDK